MSHTHSADYIKYLELWLLRRQLYRRLGDLLFSRALAPKP